MFAFQFNEMRLYCHTKSPRLWTSDSIWMNECTSVRAAVDGYKSRIHSHGVWAEMIREGTLALPLHSILSATDGIPRVRRIYCAQQDLPGRTARRKVLGFR